MAHGAAAALQERPDHRETPRELRLKFAREARKTPRIEELGVNAGKAHGIAAARERGHIAIGVRQIDDAARAVHDVVVQIPRECLPAPQRILIEVVVLRQEVIRADDRGIAPDIAVTEQALLEDGHPLDAMISRQMVGRCQAMPAGSDDDYVVGIAEPRPGPKGPPIGIACQAGTQQRPSRIPRSRLPQRPSACRSVSDLVDS